VVLTTRRAEPERVRGVVQIAARCAACRRMRRVVQMADSSCRVVLCRCSRHMRLASERRLMDAEHAVAADAHSATRSGLF
jgi:hypothetical protein